ncbi:MAG: hypothetical protein JO033_07305 [Acidobacteriaceae bacterium]|nr:hypothetical protein [Acidobacteriaceae bacterium]MBV9502980.1 hypothetical protein [Acidobacteriaceae bacterium]
MPQFLKLPSGVVINVALIRRIAPNENGGASVYFGSDDTITIDSQDADFLSKRLGPNTSLSSTIKVAVFWIVVAAALTLVYLATRTTHL